ncbi:MAPEG family protein [Hyphomonas sp.]|uniref:MAPEG family protein n=1 Tax=Hyphomonas sp. TaxID=87 RepID=UPI003919A92F
MTPVAASAIYIAVNILLLWFLSFRVIGRRRAAQVSLGTGGDSELEIRTRAHGNAAEYIPITMLGLYVLASLGAPMWMVNAVGGVFTLGRVLHAIGLSATIMPARLVGMVLTWTGMLGAAAGLLYVTHT